MAQVPVEMPAEESEPEQTEIRADAVAIEPIQEAVPTPTAQSSRFSFLKRLSKRNLAITAVAVIVLAVGGVVYALVNDRNKLKEEVSKLSSSESQAANEASRLRAEVAKHMLLPEDEVPTVATVVDVAKVKNQPFFANAHNGDKVLLFAKIERAILYRPSTQKIIEVAPINIGNDQKSGGVSPTTNN